MKKARAEVKKEGCSAVMEEQTCPHGLWIAAEISFYQLELS